MIKENEKEQERVTPFSCHENDRIVFDKRKMEVKSMVKRLKVRQQDEIVIEALRKYTYLNAYMLGNILEWQMNFPRSAVKDLLSHLVSGKMISRFRIAYNDSRGIEHRSSFVYMLKSEALTAKRTELNSREVYSYLAFNQFFASVTKKYSNAFRSAAYWKGRNETDGKLVFRSGQKLASMQLVTMRKQPEHETKEKFLEISEGMEKQENLLIICESEPHAVELEKIRKQIKGLAQANTFYITDHVTAFSDEPFCNLLHFGPDSSMYEIVSIPIDTLTLNKR